MNKIQFFLSFVFRFFVSLFVILTIVSCENRNEPTNQNAESVSITIMDKYIHNYGPSIYKVNIDNHIYGVVSGAGIVHLESCPCKNYIDNAETQGYDVSIKEQIEVGIAVGDTDDGI